MNLPIASFQIWGPERTRYECSLNIEINPAGERAGTDLLIYECSADPTPASGLFFHFDKEGSLTNVNGMIRSPEKKPNWAIYLSNKTKGKNKYSESKSSGILFEYSSKTKSAKELYVNVFGNTPDRKLDAEKTLLKLLADCGRQGKEALASPLNLIVF